MFSVIAKYLTALSYSDWYSKQLITFFSFSLAAMIWTVGMAKPDTAAKGQSQQMWDAGMLACHSPI